MANLPARHTILLAKIVMSVVTSPHKSRRPQKDLAHHRDVNVDDDNDDDGGTLPVPAPLCACT